MFQKLNSEEEQNENEQSSKLLNTAVAVPPSTLGHKTAAHCPSVKAEFNVEFDIVKDPDPELGSSAVKAEQTHSKMDMAQRVSRLTHNCSTIIQPMSVAGTGFHLRKMAGIRAGFPAMIDLLVQSHRLHSIGDVAEVEPKRMLLAALAYPQLDPGAIMIDHRSSAIGMGDVAAELAWLMVTAAHLDLTNFQDRCYTACYHRVEVGGMTQNELAQTIEQKTRTSSSWFSPEEWAPWTDDQDAVSENPPRQVVAIVPTDYDRINGQGMNLTPRTADVNSVHLLIVTPISTQWIEQELMAGAIDFLEDKLLDPDPNPIWYAWRWQCNQFGIRDYEGKFKKFRDEHFSTELL